MVRTTTATPDRTLLLRFLDDAYDHKAWHGPNLKGAIRRIAPDQAVWRPRPGRRNIAEIVLHCAYWKYAVRRRIRGDRRGSVPLKGSNWFSVPPQLAQSAWRDYLAILDAEHAALREAVANGRWSALTSGPGGGRNAPAQHVYGAALHDIYHAGQIQTLKALHKARGG